MLLMVATVLHWLENEQGMRIGISAQGAAWQSCQIPMKDGRLREVVLGSDDPIRMSQGGAYLGSSVGRYCGRIANAHFMLGGETHLVDANEEPNHLHGGFNGLSRQSWQVMAHTKESLVLEIFSAHGEAGFPGNATVRVVYHLDDNNALTIAYHAETDRPTVFNLCNHAYFNLNGVGQPALNQRLMIHAARYMPVGTDNIPVMDSEEVAGTEFDFRALREISQGIYDHSFWLEDEHDAAVLESSSGDLRLSIATTQPALHLYTGQGLAGEKDSTGREYGSCAGIALETQAPPDSANRHLDLVYSDFDHPYFHRTHYHFIV